MRFRFCAVLFALLAACSSNSLPPETKGPSSGAGGGGGVGGGGSGGGGASEDAGLADGDGGLPPFALPGTAGTAGCTLTASGALTATNSPCIVDVYFDGKNLDFDFGSSDFTFIANLASTATFNAQTYTPTNVTGFSSTVADLTTDAVWEAAVNQAIFDTQGTFSLTVTSIGTEFTSGTASGWDGVHGSFDETLIADDPSATGSIAVHIDF
jgi:hypothetical protein